MGEVVLYFFRQKKLFFYSGLLALASIYSYLLALYFLEWSNFQIDLFNTLLAFSLVWLILFLISFSKNKQRYALEREKEKFDLLRHQITNEHQLDVKNNIFEKIKLISSFMKENFSTKSLLTIRVMKIANSSLTLYIDNLKIKKQLTNAYTATSSSDDKKVFYQEEIIKNSEQNKIIEEKLNDFIKELMSKHNNDSKVDNIMNEFEHSMQLLTKIQPR
jgi:signal transduction histidine kinase